MLNRTALIATVALGLLANDALAIAPRTVADDYFLSSICLHPTGAGFAADAPDHASENMPTATHTPDSASTELYLTDFSPHGWSGEVFKERLGAPGVRTLLWRATEQLPGTRLIKLASTSSASGLQDFAWTALNETQRQWFNSGHGGLPDNQGEARLRLLRGERCDGLNGCDALAIRPLLGDTLHSRPVSVAQPARNSSAMETYDGPPGAYATFKATPRRAQLYVGANDGMLHAFDAQTGEERLAFIPSAVLARLPALVTPEYLAEPHQHRHFVDGRLVVDDVFYRGAWHTVLLGSLGAGGRGLFALDITDPEQISLLWEFTDQNNNLGYLLGTPSIARLHSGQWAAVFGNGEGSPSNRAALYLVDIQTGALIKRLEVPAPSSALAMPLLTDTDSDGNADYAYAGDDLGNLWRFDLYDPQRLETGNDSHGGTEHLRLSFAGKPLFTSPTGQPQAISTAPTVASHPLQSGYLIIVGTGQNHRPDRPNEPGPYRLYGIWDRYTQRQDSRAYASVTLSDLQAQHLQLSTSGEAAAAVTGLSRHPINWYAADNQPMGKLGWYLDLRPAHADHMAERLLDTPRPLGDRLLLHTRMPTRAPCAQPDQQQFYVIDPTLGGQVPNKVLVSTADQWANEVFRLDALPSPVLDGLIVPNPIDGMPCLLGDTGCTALSLGPRANGRQSWRVLTDVAP